MTSDVNTFAKTFDNVAILANSGGDLKDAQLEALYQIATGLGRDINHDGDFEDLGELEPQPLNWRADALRLVILATDGPFHKSCPNLKNKVLRTKNKIFTQNIQKTL